jgi:hypothetical protein
MFQRFSGPISSNQEVMCNGEIFLLREGMFYPAGNTEGEKNNNFFLNKV